MNAHKFILGEATHGQTLRICQHCGESHILTQDPITLVYAWEPVATMKFNKDGKLEPTAVEGCDAEIPVVTSSAPVSSRFASTTTPKEGVCHCPTCKGEKQHWTGDARCLCDVCKGKMKHRG